jgi:hypothetical protein
MGNAQLTPEQKAQLLERLGNTNAGLQGNNALITALIGILNTADISQQTSLYQSAIALLCKVGGGREDALRALLNHTRDPEFQDAEVAAFQALLASIPDLSLAAIGEVRDSAVAVPNNADISRVLVIMLCRIPTTDDATLAVVAQYLNNTANCVLRQGGRCTIAGQAFTIDATRVEAIVNALYALDPQFANQRQRPLNTGTALRKAAVDYTEVASLEDRLQLLARGQCRIAYVQEMRKTDQSLIREYVLLEHRTAFGYARIYKIGSDHSVQVELKHPDAVQDIAFKKGLFNIPQDEHDAKQYFVIDSFMMPITHLAQVKDRLAAAQSVHDEMAELCEDQSLQITSLGNKTAQSYHVLCSESQATLDIVTMTAQLGKDIKKAIDDVSIDLASLRNEEDAQPEDKLDKEFLDDPLPSVRNFYLVLNVLLTGLYDGAYDVHIKGKPAEIPLIVDRGGVFANNAMSLAKGIVSAVGKNVGAINWVGPLLGCAVDMVKDCYRYHQGQKLQKGLESQGYDRDLAHKTLKQVAKDVTIAWRGQIANLTNDATGIERAAKWAANRLFFNERKKDYRPKRIKFLSAQYDGIIPKSSLNEVMEHDLYYITLLSRFTRTHLLKTRLTTETQVPWTADDMFAGVGMKVNGTTYPKVAGGKDYTGVYGPIQADKLGTAITAGFDVPRAAVKAWLATLAPQAAAIPLAAPAAAQAQAPTLQQEISGWRYLYPKILTTIRGLAETCNFNKFREGDTWLRWPKILKPGRVYINPELQAIAQAAHVPLIQQEPNKTKWVSGSLVYELLHVVSTDRGYNILGQEAAVRQWLL